MANSSTSQGALQRSGVQRLVTDHRGKKRRKMESRRIHESASKNPFQEKGEDEQKGKASGKKNRVYLVTIIEEGLGNSKDKNYYSGEALQNGINVFNGAKAFCDHPDAISEKTLPERSMRDVVGWYTDCFTDKNPQTGKVRLRGKLHIFPDAKWLSDKIDVILTDPTAKNLFGISINAIGKTRPATMQGEEVNYVEEFQRVDSADVVTEPAARGKFDQMLESRRRNGSGSKVSVSMRKSSRTREAAALSSEKAKEVADSLVSAYNSDNPDEAKQAMFEAAKILHASASISGKGPGQSNEEQYSNINPSGGPDSGTNGGDPSGGSEDMKTHVKASAGRRPLRFKKKKALKAAAGKGPDNEDEGEPGPGDIESHLESRRSRGRESDVEDEESDQDLGAQDDFGGGSRYRSKEARANAEEAFEDEGFEDEGMEDEDEGFEDEGMEDEDENVGMAPGGSTSPGTQPGAAAPMGGGAPGSSRSVASAEADDGESDDGESESDDDDLDDMDEAAEDEHGLMRPGNVSESRYRGRARGREASFSGGLGDSGHSALPKGVDDTKGYTDRDESYGREDDSTSGVGKSYKIKTSRFAKNRKARQIAKPIVREANRRIEYLTEKIRRLTESNRGKDRKIVHYRGKFRMMESGRTATSLLREAVRKEILPEGVASDLYRDLLGLGRDDQIRRIKSTARFLESAQEGVVSRLTESVEGNGARGGVVSWGPAGAEDSELVSSLAGDGVPMKQDE